MTWLRQNTGTTLIIGAFVDISGSPTVGLTLAPSAIILSKNGGALAAKQDAATATATTLGHYRCDLTASDTDTLGRLRLACHPSGVLGVWHDYMVVPANVWDSMFGADKLDVNAVEIGSSSVAAANVVTNIPNLDTAVSTRSILDASGVWSYTNRLITDMTGSALASINNIPSANWNFTNRLITDMTGSALASINNIPSANWNFTTRMITDMTGSAKTAVNTEMLDVLVTDTFAELAAVPAAASSIKDKLNWIFALSRNKLIINSDTGHSLRNDTDAGNIATAAHSDVSATGSGTYTRNKWA